LYSYHIAKNYDASDKTGLT